MDSVEAIKTLKSSDSQEKLEKLVATSSEEKIVIYHLDFSSSDDNASQQAISKEQKSSKLAEIKKEFEDLWKKNVNLTADKVGKSTAKVPQFHRWKTISDLPLSANVPKTRSESTFIRNENEKGIFVPLA